MLDKLIDLLISLWHNINPFIIVKVFDRGVLLRWGKFVKILEPGFHVKLPFVDEYIKHHIVPTTLNLASQSLITSDNKEIVIKAMVKFKVSDIKVFLLEVWDTQDAFADVTQAIIKNILMSKTFQECTDIEIDNLVTKKARVEAKKCGVEIIQVTLTDIGQIRTIRLMTDSFINNLNIG